MKKDYSIIDRKIEPLVAALRSIEGVTTIASWKPACHFLPVVTTKARPAALLLVLVLTLSACGANREIQQDGTGTDELLKSPCVCLPVPYSPPAFQWGVG